VPDKEKCEAFLRAQKNVAEKKRTKGAARLRFFVARAAEGGEAYTDLLGAVHPFFITSSQSLFNLISISSIAFP
jgi:hypothetical protein